MSETVKPDFTRGDNGQQPVRVVYRVPVMRSIVTKLGALIQSAAILGVAAAPFGTLAWFSKQLRYDFSIGFTNKEPTPTLAPQEPVEATSNAGLPSVATMFPEPTPPPEPEPPSFADDLSAMLSTVHAQPGDRQRLAEVFRLAAANIRATTIGGDSELASFLGVTAVQELGPGFQAWEPFLNFFAESLSALKTNGQIGDNDMSALAEICVETGRLLAGGGQ